MTSQGEVSASSPTAAAATAATVFARCFVLYSKQKTDRHWNLEKYRRTDTQKDEHTYIYTPAEGRKRERLL